MRSPRNRFRVVSATVEDKKIVSRGPKPLSPQERPSPELVVLLRSPQHRVACQISQTHVNILFSVLIATGSEPAPGARLLVTFSACKPSQDRVERALNAAQSTANGGSA